MKKALSLSLAVLLVLFSLAGCADTEKQDAIVNYINNDLAKLGEAEAAFMESYASVSGDNYTDDATMLAEFSENTVILARKLSDLATEMSGEITDTDVLNVHKIYMNGSSKFLSALTTMIAALENQDYEKMTAANESINEANNLMLEYSTAVKALAEENGVVLE